MAKCTFKIKDVYECERGQLGGYSRCRFHNSQTLEDLDSFKEAFRSEYRTSVEQQSPLDLTGTKFPSRCQVFEELLEGNSEHIECPIILRHCEFQQPISFERLTFHHGVDFSNSLFRKGCSFRNSLIVGSALFEKCVFEEFANFSESYFESSEKKVERLSTDDFSFGPSPTQHHEAIFSEAQFKNGCSFSAAAFDCISRFRKTEFSHNCEFVLTEFKNDVDLFAAKGQRGSTLTFDAGIGKQPVFHGEARFVNFHTLNPGGVLFRKTDLSHCRFLETDVSFFRFDDVRWALTDDTMLRAGRKCTYDELNPDLIWWDELYPRPFGHRDRIPPERIESIRSERAKYQYALIIQLYRRLQFNMTQAYDYVSAGDFYVGEQEMLRMNQSHLGQFLSVRNLYRVVCRYGQSYLMPLLWSVLCILATPAIVLLTGVSNYQSGDVTGSIRYNISLRNIDISHYLADYFHVFWANVKMLTFYKLNMSLIAANALSETVLVVDRLIVYILVAFVVLALRRRFKRKSF